jgi:hypothetical protein
LGLPFGEHLKYLVEAQGRPVGLRHVVVGAASPWRPRSLHRVVARGSPAQPALGGVQHPLPDSAEGGNILLYLAK